MLKTISMVFVSLALSAAIGCSDSGTTPNPGQDGPTNNPVDMAQGQSNPDMAFVCTASPMTNDELLNGCAPASVDKVDITPFYPSMAPGGVLPQLP